jgi:ATP-binding cassette subfamily C protein LapB
MQENKNIKDSIEVLEEKLDKELSQEEPSLMEDNLRVSFEKILAIFNKNVSYEVLYSDLDISKEKLDTTLIIKIAKKIGLQAEVRRINILDIKSGPCILVQKKAKSFVVVDSNQGFDPELKEDVAFDAKALHAEYTGYAIFFYEEDLTVSSFLSKTSFLFQSVGKFKHVMIEVLVITFFINIFALVSPFYTMNIYDRVIPNAAYPTLFVLSVGMILVYIFDWIFKVIKSYLADYISLSIGSEVDQVLLQKILTAKSSSINMSNGAKGALFKELSMVREFYFSRFIPTLVEIPFLILFFIVLGFISPWLMIVPLIACIIVFIVNILMQVPLQSTHSLMTAEDQQRAGILTETIAGAENIKVFNATGKTLYKWRRVLDKSYKTSFSYNLWVNISSNFSVFMTNIVTVIMMIVGVYEINAAVMTTGGLIASSTLSGRIMATIIAFSGMIVRYRSIQNTLKHLEKIITSPNEEDDVNYEKKENFKGNIRFKDVTFFYPGLKQPILNKCNFNIKAGTKVAIIGKTGAGKSTITRLILGLDFANGGQIFIDDLDIHSINVKDLRSSIGYMPQKSYFFRGTIKENILMNTVNVKDEDYKKACDLAGVSLITAMSGKGDDMLVMEGGANLSGGQQQIIALARAIINNPQILIMDEPTNGMDTSLEATFMDNIKNYVKDKTFILITHKPSQLNMVDRVILVDNSTVVIDDTRDKVIEMLSKPKKG